MGFTAGLKSLFKTPIYAVIISSFLIVWFLGIYGNAFIPTQVNYLSFVLITIVILIGFNLVLLVFSLFKPVDELGKWPILLALILAIPTIFIFNTMALLFLGFCIIANQLLTAFFAFRACMDTSTKCDDYLYKKKGSRKFTRIIEFILFGVLDLWLMRIIEAVLVPFNPAIATSLRIIFYVNIVLIGFVVLRLLFVQKFSAYITLFFLLSFFYVMYIYIDIAMELADPDTAATYDIYWFLLDLFLFLYIIGSIFDKVDYLEDKIPLIKASTIATFVIIMKLFVQAIAILPNLPDVVAPQSVQQEMSLFVIFIACTILFGIWSIFKHKEGKTPEV